jgi:assimilatory nitrate reductase catalytic subunit
MSETVATTLTTCPYCGTGCGVKIETRTDGAVTVSGDPDHPANFGRLCVKGSALGETLTPAGRLAHPEIGGRRVSWETALDTVADRFRETIRDHGPDAVALYVSGQLLTEDYYVANKLMKGFVGSANIDTNSRLCMASSVAGHRRAFGSDTVPGVYEDLEAADLVVLVGANLAWCHPILFQRLAAAKRARPTLRVVTVDPRRTATSDLADLHLGLEPGSDVALFAGLFHHLERDGRRDAVFVADHTTGLDAALAAVSDFADVAEVARATGLPAAEIAAFFALFAATERVVTVYGQGVNQSSAGTDKVDAILNCHLLTGRIGREGQGPFSVTGQPNAMGGREVGGLANQLAAHLDLADPVHRDLVRDFWGSPTIAATPGLKAVDLFDAVEAGRIRALWIVATNPVDSLPDADRVKRAIAGCPFVVVSEVMRSTDTTDLADVLLPARAWGEKDGTVTNSERRISRQRAFRAPVGEAMPDWWALAEVAKRMGWAEAFAWNGPAAIFREHAALSGHRPEIRRDFDISGLATLDDPGFEALVPVLWPRPAGAAADGAAKRFFADGRFFTPDGRGRFVATPFRGPRAATTADRPFRLNTGRIRDQWHTMTRTGVAPKLSGHVAEPFVEIAPADAERLGIAPATLVEIASDRAEVVVRALVTDRQRSGSLFVPIHWTDRFASAGRIDALVASEVDPISGQPESKAAVVSMSPFPAVWYGFAVLRDVPVALDCDYWARARIVGGERFELAGRTPLADPESFAAALFGSAAEIVGVVDRRAGRLRLAGIRDGVVSGVLFIAPEPVEVARDWLIGRFEAGPIVSGEAVACLAGRPAGAVADPGRRICSCFGVGVNRIRRAVADGCRSVEAVGEATGAGTNCGSCRSEIARIVAEEGRAVAVAAE